jgi:ketosteroid isomerase-like protein
VRLEAEDAVVSSFWLTNFRTHVNGDEQRACDLVRGLFSALSDGDLEGLRSLLHPDATWEVMRAVPGERFAAGRDAIVEDFLAPVRARFVPGDPKITVRTLFASGDLVAAETEADGTVLDGSEYHNRYAWVIEVDGSLVRAVREYMDTAYAKGSYRP